MRTLVVDYCVSSEFKIPRSIPLLSVEDNKKCCDSNDTTPWSWWIKYDTLYYYDNNKVVHTINTYFSATDSDFKYPKEDSAQFDDDDDDDEENDDDSCGSNDSWLTKEEEPIEPNIPDDGNVYKFPYDGRIILMNSDMECWELLDNNKLGKWLGIYDYVMKVIDTEVPEPEFEDEDEEEEEKEDEWVEIYHSCPIQEFTNDKVFDRFKDKKNTFYQTYGGGAVGGYLVVADNGVKIYDVDKRGLGQDWTCDEMRGQYFEFRDEDRKNGICRALKICDE